MAARRQAFRLDRNGVKNLLREFLHIALHLAVLLVAAGTVRWINAWAVAGLTLASQAVNNLVIFLRNPDLINKRGRVIQERTKSFDKVFVALYLALALTVSVLAGLDAVRYGWSHMPPGFMVLGVILYLLAYSLGAWAMAVNAHFESTVVIQSEQQICQAGPYRFIRHPGYAAAILGAPGYSLILGSWYALAATALIMLLFVMRTGLEDKTLLKELPGYRDYAQRTKYRLAPGFW